MADEPLETRLGDMLAARAHWCDPREAYVTAGYILAIVSQQTGTGRCCTACGRHTTPHKGCILR